MKVRVSPFASTESAIFCVIAVACMAGLLAHIGIALTEYVDALAWLKPHVGNFAQTALVCALLILATSALLSFFAQPLSSHIEHHERQPSTRIVSFKPHSDTPPPRHLFH